MGRGVPKSLPGAPQPRCLVTKTWPRFLGESRTLKHQPVGSVTASVSCLEGAPRSKCELEYFWRGGRFLWKMAGSTELGGCCRSPVPQSDSAPLSPKSRADFATGGLVTALPGVRTLGNTTGFGWFHKTRSSRSQAITPGFAFPQERGKMPIFPRSWFSLGQSAVGLGIGVTVPLAAHTGPHGRP